MLFVNLMIKWTSPKTADFAFYLLHTHGLASSLVPIADTQNTQ